LDVEVDDDAHQYAEPRLMTVSRHLACILTQVEQIAANASVPGATRVPINDTLATLREMGRRRVTMLLDRINAFSEDLDERAAVEQIRGRAT
jgi:hypothetical protein